MYGKFLADIIVIAHGSMVVILLLGPLVFIFGLARKLRWFRIGYYIVAVLTVLSYLFTSSCFLTNWEIWLRNRYDSVNTYASGFVYHYTNKFFGVELSPDFIFYAFIIAFVVAVISDLFWFAKCRRTIRH